MSTVHASAMSTPSSLQRKPAVLFQGLSQPTYLQRGVSILSGRATDMGNVVSVDSNLMVIAVGTRARRGVAMMAALLFAPFIPILIWLVSLTYQRIELNSFGFYASLAALIAAAIAVFAMVRHDLGGLAETLVLLNRKTGQIIARDPAVKSRRASATRFVRWNWAELDFAIDRVRITAAGAHLYHLWAVQRDENGKPWSTVLLADGTISDRHAESIYEFIRRYMAHEDDTLPDAVRCVPSGRLGFFEACKQSLMTSLVDVDETGQPAWPLIWRVLYYTVIAVGFAVALPFVLGKVAAEWSSREMRFPQEWLPEGGAPLRGIELVEPRQGVIATWERVFYSGCVLAGVITWVFMIRYVMSVFA